jgi:hypothetical protein
MIIKSVLYLAPSILLGITFVFWLLPSAFEELAPLKIVLGVLTGLGTHSAFAFLWMISLGPTQNGLLWVEGGFLLGLCFLLWLKAKKSAKPEISFSFKKLLCKGNLSSLVFWFFFILNAFTLIALMLMKPMGNFDAYAIWNLKAKMIFLNPQDWTIALSHPDVVFFHPDYPLMIPVLVSTLWIALGTITSRAPIVLAALFSLSLPLLMFFIVRHLRDSAQAFLAALLIMGAPYFYLFGTGQTADVPLAAFVLASVSLLLLSMQKGQWQYTFLAGLMAGFAGWTKNEGLMFLVAISIIYLAILVYQHSRNAFRQMAYWLGGSIPPLCVIFIFKSLYAPSSEFFVSTLWGLITDGSRYPLILHDMGVQLFSWGGWSFPILPFFLLYAVLLRKKSPKAESLAAFFCGSVALLAIVGFIAIYVITPYPLQWHLTYSADRLMFQIYPVFILFLMLFTASFQEIIDSFGSKRMFRNVKS